MAIGTGARFGRGLGMLLSLVLCGLVAASARADEDRTLVRIILIPEAENVRAAFRLSRPTDSFDFERQIDAIRSHSWSLRTPGLVLHHGTITASNGAPFREFQILIKPDDATIDRVYPALGRVGPDGRELYTPYLLGNTEAYETIIEARLPAAMTLVAGAETDRPLFDGVSADRYVYMGPRDYVTSGMATFITPPDLPPWIGNLVKGRLGNVLQLYQDRLGRNLPEPPTVLMTYDPAGTTASYRGDVSTGRIMSLRFHGPGWEERGADDSFTITHLIAHEAFHFWNGYLFNPRRGAEQPWLHEGAAEYASLLAEQQMEEIDSSGLRDDLEHRLHGCMEALGAQPLRAPDVSIKASYDCGVLVEWLIDLSTRRASDGQRDILSVWREIFDQAVRSGYRYDEEDLLRHATADDRLALNLILDTSGTERWQELPQRLRALGIAIEPTSDGLKLLSSGLLLQ